jgi:hypothetical protein
MTKNGGSYPSPPRVEFHDNGRIVILIEDFSYIDAQGEKWTAPKGAQADGASIPRALWTVLGGPLDGRYRDASIMIFTVVKGTNRGEAFIRPFITR